MSTFGSHLDFLKMYVVNVFCLLNGAGDWNSVAVILSSSVVCSEAQSFLDFL